MKTLPALSTCRDVCALFPVLEHLSLAFNKVIWALCLWIGAENQLPEAGVSAPGDTLASATELSPTLCPSASPWDHLRYPVSLRWDRTPVWQLNCSQVV